MKKVKVKMNKPVYLGQTILDINKTLMYDYFGMIILSWCMEIMRDYATQILIVLLSILKLKIFVKTLLMMVKDGKNKKVIDLFKVE